MKTLKQLSFLPRCLELTFNAQSLLLEAVFLILQLRQGGDFSNKDKKRENVLFLKDFLIEISILFDRNLDVFEECLNTLIKR